MALLCLKSIFFSDGKYSDQADQHSMFNFGVENKVRRGAHS